MKTAFKLYKNELEAINQLYTLGLIDHVEKIAKEVRAKYLYITQKRDSE